MSARERSGVWSLPSRALGRKRVSSAPVRTSPAMRLRSGAVQVHRVIGEEEEAGGLTRVAAKEEETGGPATSDEVDFADLSGPRERGHRIRQLQGIALLAILSAVVAGLAASQLAPRARRAGRARPGKAAGDHSFSSRVAPVPVPRRVLSRSESARGVERAGHVDRGHRVRRGYAGHRDATRVRRACCQAPVHLFVRAPVGLADISDLEHPGSSATLEFGFEH